MAERITKDMSQRQKLELYKSIYAGYGLRFDIEQEMEIEDKSGTRCGRYRRMSMEKIGQIRSERRLCQIYTISKILLEYKRKQ